MSACPITVSPDDSKIDENRFKQNYELIQVLDNLYTQVRVYIIKGLGQFPIQSAQILTACG